MGGLVKKGVKIEYHAAISVPLAFGRTSVLCETPGIDSVV